MKHFNQMTAVVLEQAANRVLQLDPESSRILAPLNGKRIHILIDDLALDYCFIFNSGNLIVKSSCEETVHAKINGNLSAFIQAATSDQTGDAIFTGELHFSGEINTARHFQQIGKELEIDWLAPVAELLGEQAAQRFGQGVSTMVSFARSLLNNFKQDTPEYLQEEIKVSPTRIECENFYQGVSQLRSQGDRLQARIQRLQQHD